jgi:hypothetical protein
VADVTMSMEEYLALQRLIASERESEGATLALREDKPKKKPKSNKYLRYSKNFKFRSKRKGEKNTAYLAARSKAVGRGWRKVK